MNVSKVALLAAGVAGILALVGVDVIGLTAVQLVAVGLVLGTASEVLERS